MSKRWELALAVAKSRSVERRLRVQGAATNDVELDAFLGPEGACSKCDHLWDEHLRIGACLRCLCNEWKP